MVIEQQTKKYAVIIDGKVDNIVIATKEYADTQDWVDIESCEDRVNIGYLYDGSSFFEDPEEIKMNFEAFKAAIRAERDRLLAETDFWVLPDRTVTQEQLDYRQALRDVPQQEGFPENVIWPEKP